MKNNLNSQAKLNFQQLISIVKKLRSSGGCAWDKAQTSDSLIPYFIEEVYELIKNAEPDAFPDEFSKDLKEICNLML